MTSETAVAPSIKRTWFLSLVTGVLGKVTRRDGSAIEEEASTGGEDEGDSGSVAGSDAAGSGTVTPREGRAGGARNGRAAATTMAGGRRRKAVRRK